MNSEEYVASLFSNAVLDGNIVINGAMYKQGCLMTENIMSEELYNELLKAYSKEVLACMIKVDIRSRFPEPYASMYSLI